MSVLRLEGVHREIGDFVILDEVSGAIARGERVGLVGANGAGKTTLLEIVAGLHEPDGGRVQKGRDHSEKNALDQRCGNPCAQPRRARIDRGRILRVARCADDQHETEREIEGRKKEITLHAALGTIEENQGHRVCHTISQDHLCARTTCFSSSTVQRGI